MTNEPEENRAARDMRSAPSARGVSGAASGGAAERFEKCRDCSELNERPCVFCDHCGAPQARLGRLRVTVYLVLTMAAFLGTFYFQGLLTWDWPLYALYTLFFAQFALSLAAGSWRLKWRLGIWLLAFSGAFLVFFYFLNRDGGAIFIELAADGPEAAMEHPRLFYSILGAVVAAIFIPCYIRWARVYGWVVAYRIVMMVLVIIPSVLLGALDLIHWAARRNLFPDLAESLGRFVDSQPQYAGALTFFSLMVGRIFLFEIFIFAATRGYTAAHRTKIPPLHPAAARESAFVRSLLRITQIVRLFVLILEKMALYLFHSLVLLAKDLWLVGRAFARELFAPAAAMLACGVLLYQLTRLTKAYVEEGGLASVGAIGGVVTGLLLGEMVFVGCKTPFRWRRVAVCHAQLIGWLLPNLLVFFLVMSTSLYATSAALNALSSSGDPLLPFRIGLLTKTTAALLAGLVLLIFARKRALLHAQPVAEHAPIANPAPPAAESAVQDVGPALRRPERELARKEKKRRTSRTILAKAVGAAETMLLPKGARGLLESVREWRERVFRDKPEILVELARAKARRREKVAQMKALESTRGAISAETFAAVHSQYEKQLKELVELCGRLQAKAEREHADWLLEKAEAEGRLAQLQLSKAESERLFQAGALTGKEFRARSKRLQFEMEQALTCREACDRLIALFAAETGTGPRED